MAESLDRKMVELLDETMAEKLELWKVEWRENLSVVKTASNKAAS